MKRLISLALTLTMLFTASAFAAEEYSFPLTEEPVTLTAFVSYREHMSDVTTNTMVVDYEEKTGVHIDFIQSNDANTDLNLMIAGGDRADMYLINMNTSQVMTMVDAGMIMPLNDLINEYGYYTSQVLEANPDFKANLTAPDGNIYTLFETDIGVHMPNRRKMFVKSDWLSKYRESAGTSAPANVAEFEEMLTFFRDGDMNGNGTADEIPLMGSSNGEDDPIYYLMSAFQQISNNFFHISDDGNIIFEANTDTWRDGLMWMKHLYEEGLFYAEETYVQDRDQLRAIVNVSDSSKYVVGALPTFWEGRFVDTSVLNYTDFEPIAPLTGEDGVARATITQLASFSLNSAISADCPRTDIAMRWLDWWLSDEGTFANVYGTREGYSYEIVDTPSISGEPSSVKVLLNSYTDNFRFGENMIPKNDTQKVRYAVSDDSSTYNTNNTYVLHRAGTMYEPYYVNSNIPAMVWTDDLDLQSEMNEYMTVINDIVKTAYTEFILGIRDIETEWDSYIEELNDAGLERYIELLGQYYAR